MQSVLADGCYIRIRPKVEMAANGKSGPSPRRRWARKPRDAHLWTAARVPGEALGDEVNMSGSPEQDAGLPGATVMALPAALLATHGPLRPAGCGVGGRRHGGAHRGGPRPQQR